MPKVSVIIATYNCESDIEKTIRSFNDQTYRDKELIIIDAGSTDGTVEIIKKHKKDINYWISEPDKGISDAFNKSVKAAKGDYIYFIGAGDYFWSNDSIKRMMTGVDKEKDILVCGRINRVTENGKKVLYTSSISFKKWMLLYKMGLPHQALFTNKKYFDNYGLFDENCRYAMDYELLLRAYKEFPRVVIKDVVVTAWRAGGIGTNKIDSILNEYHRIRLKNRIASVFVLNLIYLLSKLRYKIWHE